MRYKMTQKIGNKINNNEVSLEIIHLNNFEEEKLTLYSLCSINYILFRDKYLLKLHVIEGKFNNKVVIPNFYLLNTHDVLREDYHYKDGFEITGCDEITDCDDITENIYINEYQLEQIILEYEDFMQKNHLLLIHYKEYETSNLFKYLINKHSIKEDEKSINELRYSYLNLKIKLNEYIKPFVREEELNFKMSLIKKDENTIVRKKV